MSYVPDLYADVVSRRALRAPQPGSPPQPRPAPCWTSWTSWRVLMLEGLDDNDRMEYESLSLNISMLRYVQ